jgi:hypothetical protein
MILLKKKINYLIKPIQMTKRDKSTYTEIRLDFWEESQKYGILKRTITLKFLNRKIMKDKMVHLLMGNQELRIN